MRDRTQKNLGTLIFSNRTLIGGRGDWIGVRLVEISVPYLFFKSRAEQPQVSTTGCRRSAT